MDASFVASETSSAEPEDIEVDADASRIIIPQKAEPDIRINNEDSWSRFDALIDQKDPQSHEFVVRNHHVFSHDTYILPTLRPFLEKLIKTRSHPTKGFWSRIRDTTSLSFRKICTKWIGSRVSTTARKEPGVLQWPNDVPDGRYLLVSSNPEGDDEGYEYGAISIILINEEMGRLR
ncbi:hypothetical protein PFICI_02971 [Pestalotiopsis fici W106-1]|uniref:Uncharacterized protein n=1 Tax=Pestalotiopsis fici (strain W106-1 / CGMCC3.15140) TaxID=1229662 RepID=W3XI70_PESFW|nr:uncharacterized protein PFICI_02971 [Pestalotiopsis fici W106-1]ETS84946.1 hypothetical protein PFICI_02971 [Pestalotiopsis fici W106-1]